MRSDPFSLVGAVGAADYPSPPYLRRTPPPSSHRCRPCLRLSLKAQATVLELIDGAGLSDICPLMASEDDADRRLGDVMAEAVQVWIQHTSCECVDTLIIIIGLRTASFSPLPGGGGGLWGIRSSPGNSPRYLSDKVPF